MGRLGSKTPARSAPLSWKARHSLGVAVNAQMDHYCTLQELADSLGITKQMAYHESVVTLGRFTWLLSQRLGVPPAQVLRVLR